MLYYYSLKAEGNPPPHRTPTLDTSYLNLLVPYSALTVDVFTKFDMQSSIEEMHQQ